MFTFDPISFVITRTTYVNGRRIPRGPKIDLKRKRLWQKYRKRHLDKEKHQSKETR